MKILRGYDILNFINSNALRLSDVSYKSPGHDFLYVPFDFLSPKRIQMLESSWPYFFREYLYGKLPVDAIKSAFHAKQGRPSKEQTTALGTLLLQQLFDLPDEQAVRQLAFNTERHYALNLHTEDNETKTMCERTLRACHVLVIEREVDNLLFQSLTDKLPDQFQVTPRKQRLDSTNIRSNMRRLSRLDLLRKAKMKRVMKLGLLRVRGLAKVRYVVNLKVLGWNICRTGTSFCRRFGREKSEFSLFLMGRRGKEDGIEVVDV